jgi:hypothetical protein
MAFGAHRLVALSIVIADCVLCNDLRASMNMLQVAVGGAGKKWHDHQHSDPILGDDLAVVVLITTSVIVRTLFVG